MIQLTVLGDAVEGPPPALLRRRERESLAGGQKNEDKRRKGDVDDGYDARLGSSSEP